jgi:hypothetical protein
MISSLIKYTHMCISSLYYNKQPIETHGMCLLTGQSMNANNSNKDQSRNLANKHIEKANTKATFVFEYTNISSVNISLIKRTIHTFKEQDFVVVEKCK